MKLDIDREKYRRGVIAVHPSMLRTFFCLPDTALVFGGTFNNATGCWEIVIEDASLPLIDEGSAYSKVTPVYKEEIRDGERWVCFESYDVE